eukprot:PLAT4940.3.p2 GENE.PLAT4940.3~~PLAT4940.3.p2  ORF type:complete len:612 (+),score=198.54 PLAT4940.3:1294-3129(+)
MRTSSRGRRSSRGHSRSRSGDSSDGSVSSFSDADFEDSLDGVPGTGSLNEGGEGEPSSRRRRKRLRRPLRRRQLVSFSVGHVLNDMCAACWFSYLLIFLENAVGLRSDQAGLVMFAGQVADACATPTVGILSDRTEGWPSLGLGRRKSWHAGGSVAVAICYTLVWVICLPCLINSHSSNTVLTIYYAIVASVFNCGWAAVQVSHMSLVPELSADEGERVLMNSARYAFTIISNVLVFVSFFLLLHLYDGSTLQRFRYLGIITLIIGGAATLVFECLLKEKMVSRDKVARRAARGMAWKDWFKQFSFYLVGVNYMCTRLLVNISQVYVPFYVVQTLSMNRQSLALVPLIIYVASFVATTLMGRYSAGCGRRSAYFLGGLLVLAACAAFYMLQPETANWMYVASISLGLGNAIVMVSSVQMEADMIGKNTESGAFVYGAMSFTDKLSNGIGIVVIQFMRTPLTARQQGPFVRDVMTFVPGAAAILGALVAFYAVPYMQRRHELAKAAKRQRRAEKRREAASALEAAAAAAAGAEEDDGDGEARGSTAPLLGGAAASDVPPLVPVDASPDYVAAPDGEEDAEDDAALRHDRLDDRHHSGSDDGSLSRPLLAPTD